MCQEGSAAPEEAPRGLPVSCRRHLLLLIAVAQGRLAPAVAPCADAGQGRQGARQLAPRGPGTPCPSRAAPQHQQEADRLAQVKVVSAGQCAVPARLRQEHLAGRERNRREVHEVIALRLHQIRGGAGLGRPGRGRRRRDGRAGGFSPARRGGRGEARGGEERARQAGRPRARAEPSRAGLWGGASCGGRKKDGSERKRGRRRRRRRSPSFGRAWPAALLLRCWQRGKPASVRPAAPCLQGVLVSLSTLGSGESRWPEKAKAATDPRCGTGEPEQPPAPKARPRLGAAG